MNLSMIKEKYRQIIEEPELESQSEDEWEDTYQTMKNKRRRNILGESQCMNRLSLSMNHTSDEQNYLKVKEKLAQTISNAHQKDEKIEELKAENMKAQEHIKLLQEQVRDMKNELAEKEQKLQDQKVSIACIERSMENIEKNVLSEKMDKELLQRQIEYYQSQIESLKRENDNKNYKMDEIKKESKNIDKHKSVINHLKEDVHRLKELLTESEKYKVFASKIEYKHYLGKECKEHECWVSGDLIHDVEVFLKKQQIGVGNKEFKNCLAKFIAKNVEIVKNEVEKKARKTYQSKMKENERKQNHSMNVMEVKESILKKSRLGNFALRSRRNTLLNDSKLNTESFIYEKLEKSLVSHSLSKNQEVCQEILNSFRKGVLEILQSKDLKKKKLLRLVDWLVDGVLSIFPKNKQQTYEDFRLDTDEIKITL